MKIGIIKEVNSFENRVAITPEIAKKLASLNHNILIESGAGEKAYITDKQYTESGASISNKKTEVLESDIILKVNAPTKDELNSIKDGATIITFFQIKDEIDHIDEYIKKKITLLSMSHVPRTTLAQNMDALSSQSNIAGYKATIIGADHISIYMPLLMTAAGTIKPAKVLIIGAGVAGLAAIANAKRMGAQVYAFDVRPVVKEQVESLGAKFIEVESDGGDGVGEGGYAKEVSDDYKKKQGELINKTIQDIDLVITTALIPEKPAPKLIDKSMVESMKPGSTIIDLAALNGGNCELTKADEIIEHNHVIIDGRSNIPSTMPKHASQLYAKNLFNLFNHIYNENNELNMEEEITNGSTLINKGTVNNKLLQEFLDQRS
tara:strand:- start:508 stop:1641 length:1134 start_codon:yes stop_codon:yes gene_type:complete